MHITPSVAPTLDRQLNEIKMTDDIVEDKYFIKFFSWFVSIFCRSIKIKITQEQPEITTINFQVIQPGYKSISGWLPTRTIDNNKIPTHKIMDRIDYKFGSKALLFLE